MNQFLQLLRNKRLLLLLLLVLLPLTLYLVNKSTNFLGNAANLTSLEAEDGVLSGNVSIQNDSGTQSQPGASGGKYLLFNPQPTGPLPTVPPGTWIEVGTHPHASVEYNAGYKSLNTMTAWNFRLYTGFGNGHQGPVAIDSFDPLSKTFSYDGLPYTETINFLRPSFGKLYVPTFNATHTAREDSFNYTEPGKPWQEVGNLNLSYATDMVSLTGQDLFFIGNSHSTDDIDYSPDGGVTWNENVVLNVLGQMATYNKKLYVQVGSVTKVFDGSSWSDSPVTLGRMTDPRVFNGKLVYLSGGLLKSFDGTTVTTLYPTSLSRYTINGNTIYIHTTGISRTILKSTDLSNWVPITTFTSPSSSSMAVLHGKLYIGTIDSKIYEYSTPVSSLPEVILTTNDDDMSENGNQGSFTLERDGSTAGPLAVNYTISGTAGNGTDYQTLSGTVTIPSGANEVTIPVIPIQDAITNEGNETVILRLNSTSSYDAVEPSEDILTIYEKPAVTTEMVNSIAQEGNNTGSIRFIRKGDLSTPLTVTYSFPPTVDINGRTGWTIATNGTDFNLPGSITIPQGQKSADLTLSPINDSLFEGDEWVRIAVSPSSNYVRELPSRQLIKIEDNDTPSTPNLIVNPGFEDTTSWGGTRDTTVSHTGGASKKVTGPVAELDFKYVRQTVPVTMGKKYIFSCWIKTDGEMTGRGPTIRINDAGSADSYSPFIRDSKGIWQYVSGSFTATSTSIFFDLGYVINGPQSAWFDDVELHEAQ